MKNDFVSTHEPEFFGTVELDGMKCKLYLVEHSINRGKERHILLNIVPDMIKEAGEDLLDLKIEEKFIISSEVFATSVVGTFIAYNKIAIITIKDKGHDFRPKNLNDVHIKIS